MNSVESGWRFPVFWRLTGWCLLWFHERFWLTHIQRIHCSLIIPLVHSKATSDGALCCRLRVCYSFTSAAAAGSPKVSNYVRGLEPFYCFFSKTELLTIQFWLWFWTNNGAVIWAVSVCDCCQNDWEWRPPPASLQQPTPCSSLRHRKKNGGFQQSESYCSNN